MPAPTSVAPILVSVLALEGASAMPEPMSWPGYAAEQVRAAEAPLLARGEPLMQRAADALAAEVIDLLRAHGHPGAPLGDRVLVLVGPGNNGGDALFAAERLAHRGAHVVLQRLSGRAHEAGLAAALAAGAREGDPASLVADARESAVVLDGIVGIGSGPALRGRGREAVAALLPLLREQDAPLVVAVDLPSGIGADDGALADGVVLPATLTVAFGALAIGVLRRPAADLVGPIRLVDVGLDLAGVRPSIEVATDAVRPSTAVLGPER